MAPTEQRPKSRIFIVDDEEIVRKSLARFFKAHGYESELFGSAAAFLERLPVKEVGCLLLDIQMPGMTGLELQEKLAEENFPLPIIFLTAHGDVPSSVRAMKHGAQEFFSKLEEESVLLEAVERALEGSRALHEVLDLFESLTERELETCRHVIAGSLNKQIADTLGITERTVKAHRHQVMEKTGVESVAELVRLAEKAKIAPAGKWSG